MISFSLITKAVKSYVTSSHFKRLETDNAIKAYIESKGITTDTLLIWKSQTTDPKREFTSVTKVLEFCLDATKLEYASHSGNPKVAKLCSIYTGAADPWIRWDTIEDLRVLTPEEQAVVDSHDILQTKLKNLQA